MFIWHESSYSYCIYYYLVIIRNNYTLTSILITRPECLKFQVGKSSQITKLHKSIGLEKRSSVFLVANFITFWNSEHFIF